VGQSHVTSLTLNRLGEREVAAIIARMAGNKALPADVQAEIVERTDGIPLFVEEMTKAVLEAESEGAARRTAAAVPSPAMAVPASLHASLMARLDRLGPAKEVAQIGSAIGREFSHALLAAVARKSEPELASALDRLVQAGLLFRQGVPPQASYLFKHALVQGTRPMARCCASHGARCRPGSPKSSKLSLRRSLKPCQRHWRGTIPRPALSRRPRVYGERQGSGRSIARRWRKP
jgi:hypothetical protein